MVMQITVVNKHHQKPENEKGEYIGRGSPLGNPFVISPGRTRAEAIETYRVYLMRNIEVQDPDIIRELNRLLTIAQEKPLTLVCFCAPQPCHGDVIREALLSCEAVNL